MENWQAIIKEKEFNDLLLEWNKKINLVSRKKTDVFDLIEDSKLFFDAIKFSAGINILDLGTGGGFPGIVIAIHHPEVNLTLVDSIQKKINAVKDTVLKLSLTNTEVICARVEELGDRQEYKNKFDYVVARSVAVLQDLCKWSNGLLKKDGKLVALKGGDIGGEVKKAKSLKYVINIKLQTVNDRKIVVVSFQE